MTGTSETAAKRDIHSFVIRLRLNSPPDPALPPALPPASKSDENLIIRVEHVNYSVLSQHNSIAGAVDWLRGRMEKSRVMLAMATASVEALDGRTDPAS